MCAWFKLLPDPEQLTQAPFTRIIEKIQRRAGNNGKERTSPEKEFFVPEYKTPDKQNYIKTLQEQILHNNSKNSEEKLSRRAPWISNDFSPFPNRQTTPKDIRRQREKSKMILLKKDLDQQLFEKSIRNDQKNKIEHQRIKSILDNDIQEFHDFEKFKYDKEKSERIILSEAWGQALSSRHKTLNRVLHDRSDSPDREWKKSEDNVMKKVQEGNETSGKLRKNILDKRIEQILSEARRSHHEKNFSSQFKSTNQIIKGGRKHFN